MVEFAVTIHAFVENPGVGALRMDALGFSPISRSFQLFMLDMRDQRTQNSSLTKNLILYDRLKELLLADVKKWPWSKAGDSMTSQTGNRYQPIKAIGETRSL